MENKCCKKCDQKMDIVHFNKDKSNIDGYSIYCRVCWSNYKKERYRRIHGSVKERKRNTKVKDILFTENERDRNINRLIVFYKRMDRRNGICSLEDIFCEMLDLSIYFFGEYNYCNMKANRQLGLMWRELKLEAEKRLMIC